jgi:hypothetical protein
MATSPAASFLGIGSDGFGGSSLTSQVQGESEEARKRRLQRQQQMAGMGPAATALGLGNNGYGAVLSSLGMGGGRI